MRVYFRRNFKDVKTNWFHNYIQEEECTVLANCSICPDVADNYTDNYDIRSSNKIMSGVERRRTAAGRSGNVSSRRVGIYIDYNEDTSKRSGVYVDTETEGQSAPNMEDTADERTHLLQQQERLERQIISEINRVDAKVDELLPHAENLAAATDRYFGEDGKVLPRKRSWWKRLCCCCRER